MNVEIPCELYVRFAEIPLSIDPQDLRKHLKSIYIERKNNMLFAVVTNISIAAIEYLGRNSGPDEHMAVAIDPFLIVQCEKEVSFNGRLEIVAVPAPLNFTSVKTTFGFGSTINMHIPLPDDHEFAMWRNWIPEAMPEATDGAMCWNVKQIYALASASKTGTIKFPEFIDTSKPVLIRDGEADNWIGLFMPNLKGEGTVQPASIPDWIVR